LYITTGPALWLIERFSSTKLTTWCCA